GILIPVGGNEDKGESVIEGYTLHFIEEGILSRIVQESGGINAKIVVITTASRIPVEVGEKYLEAFTKLGCTDVSILDIRERDDAEKDHAVKLAHTANCVMFSGGDQSRIVDIIGDSTFHRILKHRFQNDRIVIAGTSAGAMAMSSEMISGGSSSEAMFKGSVKMTEGMKFIPGLIIDSHFIQRGRFGRLAEAVARHPHLLGIGLAEDTGLIIENCNRFTVIGSGMVIIFDPSELTHNNVEILDEGIPLTMSNLKVHVLANSDSFSLEDRNVHVLPIHADFE
ncbi:MAG: cyanophycinase, partial [Saprospiraceae bacterium]|nr:cyanophycinase [Saprospiraceae bacterium]